MSVNDLHAALTRCMPQKHLADLRLGPAHRRLGKPYQHFPRAWSQACTIFVGSCVGMGRGVEDIGLKKLLKGEIGTTRKFLYHGIRWGVGLGTGDNDNGSVCVRSTSLVIFCYIFAMPPTLPSEHGENRCFRLRGKQTLAARAQCTSQSGLFLCEDASRQTQQVEGQIRSLPASEAAPCGPGLKGLVFCFPVTHPACLW